MLYKRAFRKEKEVITFLIKAKMLKSAWNLKIEPRTYQSEATDWAFSQGASRLFPAHWHRQNAGSRAPAKITL